MKSISKNQLQNFKRHKDGTFSFEYNHEQFKTILKPEAALDHRYNHDFFFSLIYLADSEELGPVGHIQWDVIDQTADACNACNWATFDVMINAWV